MKSKVFISFIAGLMLLAACGEKDGETMKLNKTNVPLDKALNM